LLGLLEENEGVAAKSLAQFDLYVSDVYRDIVELVGEGETIPSGHVPFTPKAKKSLEKALREALKLGHNYIGTEHLLLGIIETDEGVGEGHARAILNKHMISLEALREVVLGLVPPYEESEPEVEKEDPPVTVTSQVILDCVVSLNRLDNRERKAVLAYLESWFDDC
jgi:ATP-dependent Clp protease ATP-binding subunit ClpC